MTSRRVLCITRGAAGELTSTFISKAHRETLKGALSRGNALMITTVEVDFAFAPERSVIATCHAVLAGAAMWRSLSW